MRSLPALVLEATLGRSLKATVSRGTLADPDATPVTVKQLVDTRPLWRWYFEREVKILRVLSRVPSPVMFPRFVDADVSEGRLILEYLPGPALARMRRAGKNLSPTTIRALVDAQRKLASWTEGADLFPIQPPSPAIRTELRARMLEDPTSPLDWCTEGLSLGHSLGLIDADLRERSIDAIRAHPRTVVAHGDLLPRNVLYAGDDVALIDWECAGPHLEGWDLALLWTNLYPAQRTPIEERISSWTAPAQAAFRACTVFALVREMKFRRSYGAQPQETRDRELRDDLQLTSEALAAGI